MKLRLTTITDYPILRDLVRSQADSLHGHVRILEKEIPTDWGPVMLGMDGEGRPVVVMLSLNRDDDIMVRLIGIYRWTHQSMPLLIRFCAKGWLDTTKVPRFIVIVPGLSQAYQDGKGLLSFAVETYVWRGIDADGELYAILEPIGEPLPRLSESWSGNGSTGLLEAARLSESESQFFEKNYLEKR
jgi:hypothetical protein